MMHTVALLRLPSAHTCFNHLLLPEYESEEQLEERFMTAISECSGWATTDLMLSFRLSLLLS